MSQPLMRFNLADAQRASLEWGANCGPGAIAAVCGLTLDELRPHLLDFERKRYTNPALMYAVLRGLGVRFDVRMGDVHPFFGLARVQWDGPWTAPGVPLAARYRHTHWIGIWRHDVFDINCICVGGWVSREEWDEKVAPWLMRTCEPRGNGRWYVTHAIDLIPASALSCRSRLEAAAS